MIDLERNLADLLTVFLSCDIFPIDLIPLFVDRVSPLLANGGSKVLGIVWTVAKVIHPGSYID